MTPHPTDDLAAFAIGALDRPDAARVEDHLAACAACRTEVASFDEVAWGIAELAPMNDGAADLRGRVVARASRQRAVASSRSSGFGALGRLFSFRVPVAVPLALAVLFGVSVAGLQGARSEADAYGRALAGVAAGTVVSLAPTPGSDVRGSLVLTEGGDPYLILRLPAPPAGKTWEAWVIRGERPIPAGISGTRSGVVTLVLSENVRPGDVVALTLENAGGVPLPQGPVVLQGRT